MTEKRRTLNFAQNSTFKLLLFLAHRVFLLPAERVTSYMSRKAYTAVDDAFFFLTVKENSLFG